MKEQEIPLLSIYPKKPKTLIPTGIFAYNSQDTFFYPHPEHTDRPLLTTYYQTLQYFPKKYTLSKPNNLIPYEQTLMFHAHGNKYIHKPLYMCRTHRNISRKPCMIQLQNTKLFLANESHAQILTNNHTSHRRYM